MQLANNLQPQRWNKTIQTKWSHAERATLGEAKSWEEVDPHTSVWVSVPDAQCTHTHTHTPESLREGQGC